MKKSETINELAAALSKAQGEMKNAPKDSKNPFFNSTYSDLASVIDAARGPLSKNGLSVVQMHSIPEPNKLILTTALLHSSGQWIESDFPIVPSKGDMQGLGAATTYARRFSYQSIIGMASEDDDGNAASGLKAPADPMKAMARLELLISRREGTP